VRYNDVLQKDGASQGLGGSPKGERTSAFEMVFPPSEVNQILSFPQLLERSWTRTFLQLRCSFCQEKQTLNPVHPVLQKIPFKLLMSRQGIAIQYFFCSCKQSPAALVAINFFSAAGQCRRFQRTAPLRKGSFGGTSFGAFLLL
jgi:hypothetical protein